MFQVRLSWKTHHLVRWFSWQTFRPRGVPKAYNWTKRPRGLGYVRQPFGYLFGIISYYSDSLYPVNMSSKSPCKKKILYILPCQLYHTLIILYILPGNSPCQKIAKQQQQQRSHLRCSAALGFLGPCGPLECRWDAFELKTRLLQIEKIAMGNI